MSIRPARILAITLLPSLAIGATLKVPRDHATIQAAVDAAADGDTIAVGKGTYAPFAVIGRSGLVLKGSGKPVVDGGGGTAAVVLVSSSTGVFVDGLVVRNSSDRAIEVSGGSQDVTVRRCDVSSAYDGIRVFDSTSVVVERNRFGAIENDAIDTSSDDDAPPASDAVVRKNRIEGSENAIEIEGSGHLIEKNRIDGTNDSGIEMNDSSGVTVAKNRITNSGDEGIAVRGTGHRIEKNFILRPNEDGIDVEGSQNEFVGNKIQQAGDSGIEVGTLEEPGQATGNLLEANAVTSATANGFHVSDGGNTFRRNKATRSGGFDLLDEAGGNVYEANKFKTQQVP